MLKSFARREYRNPFLYTIGSVVVAAGIGAAIAAGIGLAGAAAAVTVPAIISGATIGALATSAVIGVGTLLVWPITIFAGGFNSGSNEPGGMSGTFHASVTAGLASLAVIAGTDGPRLMSERFPTPEQRVAQAANKAFECKSTSSDVQVTRNPQGEPVSVTVSCRR